MDVRPYAVRRALPSMKSIETMSLNIEDYPSWLTERLVLPGVVRSFCAHSAKSNMPSRRLPCEGPEKIFTES